MRALVTGAAGFVGSHLTEWLLAHGETVAVLMRPGTDAGRLEAALPRVTRIAADLEALGHAQEAIRDFAPDVVFHLAWRGVGNANHQGLAQVERNLPGSLALLRLASEAGCRTFVGTGSQTEYGRVQGPVAEEKCPAPTTLYGAAKLCTGLLGRLFATGMGLRFVWLRLFQLYGPREPPHFVIPYVIESLLAGEKPLLTAGEQRWDYLFVEDAVEAMHLTALAPAAAGVYNLGSGTAPSLREVLEAIRDLIDPKLPLGFGEVPYRADQVTHLQADVRRLREATGWAPRTALDDGLRRTIAWHRGRRQA
jgi:nucleoside-diphosphate-sugar epimerase